jgi:hypothetical protein
MLQEYVTYCKINSDSLHDLHPQLVNTKAKEMCKISKRVSGKCMYSKLEYIFPLVKIN